MLYFHAEVLASNHQCMADLLGQDLINGLELCIQSSVAGTASVPTSQVSCTASNHALDFDYLGFDSYCSAMFHNFAPLTMNTMGV